MAYYLNLFSPETYAAFSRSSKDISGFRPGQQNAAAKIKPGDKLICYMTRLSRWVGILEVVDGPFSDSNPIFVSENDPFTVRFRVIPEIWLDALHAVPIRTPDVWRKLSFTRDHDPRSSRWTGRLRASLSPIEEADAHYLEELILAQRDGNRLFPLNDSDQAALETHAVRRTDKTVAVTVPPAQSVDVDELGTDSTTDIRESLKIQALLADIGSQMGLKIWIPKADRGGVSREWKDTGTALLDRLPLNYDDATLKTIEQIDILWLRGRSIVRAFEVEHTTSVYSGLLRMADLLALQPNMDIRLHIVAPLEKRDKVFQEIRRPVFSLLERGPLSELCTYLSYDALRELATQKHLAHLSDTVVDEYAEEAD